MPAQEVWDRTPEIIGERGQTELGADLFQDPHKKARPDTSIA
jgi:hypothetical protein